MQEKVNLAPRLGAQEPWNWARLSMIYGVVQILMLQDLGRLSDNTRTLKVKRIQLSTHPLVAHLIPPTHHGPPWRLHPPYLENRLIYGGEA